jgi:hypothetical protein
MTAFVGFGGGKMGEGIVSAPVGGLAAKDRITAEDVLLLRGQVFRDGVVTPEEAESLFALDTSAIKKCPEWPVFFIEAITDYIVHQEKPSGYISAANAEWLIGVVSRDGMVDTRTELELLVTVLEKAKFSPAKLSAYALQQVMHAVVDGKGPLAKGGELEPGRITKAEVELLRRILYAFGGDGNVAVTRAEAEVLLTINERAANAPNDPSWNDLFVKAMANFVMCGSGYEAPTREKALRQDAFIDASDVGIGGFFVRMASGGVAGILDAYSPFANVDTDWEAHNLSREAQARRAESIDAGEARWLVERIGGKPTLHENERALLKFIKQMSPSIHPDLLPLIDRVA